MALLLAWPLPPAQSGEIQYQKREGRGAVREKRAEAGTDANANASNYKQLYYGRGADRRLYPLSGVSNGSQMIDL